jgi:hypothetical protein
MYTCTLSCLEFCNLGFFGIWHVNWMCYMFFFLGDDHLVELEIECI